MFHHLVSNQFTWSIFRTSFFFYMFYLFKAHWTWCSSFRNFNILMHVTRATYLSNWIFLGMEMRISLFYHSGTVITGSRMGTWCSLIKYCICNQVKCYLMLPCSKLSLPQEKEQFWNVGYEVLLNKLQQKRQTWVFSLLLPLWDEMKNANLF